MISPDADDAYTPADGLVLARVPADRIRDLAAYEFFTGVNPERPEWSHQIDERRHILTAAGRCYRLGVSYNAGLQRYLMCQIVPGEADMRFEGGLGLYEAPEPWGPWHSIYFTEKWDVGPGDTGCIPTKWMSDDGLSCYLVFAGDDCFSVRHISFDTQTP